MSNLLIFFALPLATIILSIVLERVWNNYILVTLFTFAIYLIVAFALGDANLLTLVIAYTVLALISAFLSMLFRKISERIENIEETMERNDRQRQNESLNNNSNCSCNRNNTQNVAINASFTPNRNNNGRTGSIRGQYRRLNTTR